MLTASSEHSYAYTTDDLAAKTSQTRAQDDDPPLSAEGMMFVFPFHTKCKKS